MSARPDDWARAREIFEEALARPDIERLPHVTAACAGNETLRDEVVRMLASHDRAAGFLSTPAADLLAPGTMPSLAGQQIGPYLLVLRIGAGGMGDVYRARDTRLDRTVAVKVLSARLGGDARARFDREARAIAGLSHPNICALYDVGEAATPAATAGDASPSAALRYLVMEHLEGETLAARLADGALPIDQALRYATQIASALEKAHRAGIVHRDLKPANLMIVKHEVKLLDFGLAKDAVHGVDPAVTTPGTIVGTVQYMAPEQLRGRDADSRSDIFAFGVVLYEMLTGAKAFPGDNQLSVGAAILDREPVPLRTLVASAPPALDRVVSRCLAKDPDERWQSTSDLASELRWIAHASSSEAPHEPPRRSASWRTPTLVAAALAAAAASAAVVAIGSRWLTPAPLAPGAPKHFVVTIPDYNRVSGFALLPDASGIVYQSNRDERLHLQALRDEGSHPLAGTETSGGAGCIIVSPDGKWVGFGGGGRPKKVELTGGVPLPFGGGCLGSWGLDDHIVSGGVGGGLMRTPGSGARPEVLTTLAPGELAHMWPQWLPGGKGVVFTAMGKNGVIQDAAIEAVAVRDKQRRVLVKGATKPFYSPTGHLLFVRGADLFAVPFDADRLTVRGNPVRVLSGVYVGEYLGAQVDLAADGTLAYVPGGGEELERTLLWVDRKGTTTPVPMGERPYAHLNMLPDQRGLIVEIEGATHNIWHQDLESGVLTPLTTGAGNHRPVLSPDGRFMVYSSDRTRPRTLYLQATDGSGTAEHLTDSPGGAQNATSWSPDGRWVAFEQFGRNTNSDIWVLPMDGERRARPFLESAFAERQGAFSPDGRWMAFTTDESGRSEVMVTAFPGPGPRKQVSTSGGSLPAFSRDGRHLFYRLADGIWDAELLSADPLTFTAPKRAFDIPNATPNTQLPYPVAPGGDAVLYAKDHEGGFTRIHLIVNFFEELRRLAPTN
jgi:serine/threonine protein kinase